jgi:hypothetical protein
VSWRAQREPRRVADHCGDGGGRLSATRSGRWAKKAASKKPAKKGKK